MTDSSITDSSIQQQAANWLTRRHSGTWTLHDNIELQAWLQLSPMHRQTYEQLARMWSDLDAANPALADLRDAARQYRPATTYTNQRHRLIAWGMAASALLSVGGAYWQWIGFDSQYRTAKGQTQEIRLADGSTLRLNTDTEVVVTIGGSRRSVELVHGQALFDVVHDQARPFVVNAGAGRIEDIGTRFDVEHQAGQVAVNVLEGSLQISRNDDKQMLVTLSADQSSAYDSQGELIPGYHSDVQTAVAWLDGNLVFNDLPLPQALAQLARYHPVEFDASDSKLKAIKVSGSFQADNLALILKTLQASFPIRISQLDQNHIRIQRR